MSREVTEATPLICSSRAPLGMVLLKQLKPTPKKKPVGKSHDDRAKVDKVDKTNAEIVESEDDEGDIAKGTESQIDDVAKIERDKASEAKTDAVAENINGEVPQECDSKANVEQSTEAPQQRQPLQLCSDTDGAPDCDSAQHVQQRTAEQFIDVPDDAGTSVQQRSVEQVVDVLDDAGTDAQQRTVEQVVDAPAETEPATHPLDCEPLDVTQRVERPEVRAKLRQDLLRRKARSHDPCGLSSNASDTSRQPSDASSAQERVLLNERLSDAVPSTQTSVCARDRTNSRFFSVLAERIDTTRRDLRSALSCGRIRCSSTCRIRSNSTSGRVCDRDGVQSEHEGEQEKQCIEFCHEAEIAGLNEALSILSGDESLFDQMSSKNLLHRHSSALDHHRVPALTDLSLHLR